MTTAEAPVDEPGEPAPHSPCRLWLARDRIACRLPRPEPRVPRAVPWPMVPLLPASDGARRRRRR